MVSNQEDFTTPIEDKLTSPRDQIFYKKESLAAIWQFTSV